MIMQYCEPNSAYVYKVQDDKILFIEKVHPYKYDDTSNLRMQKKIFDDGRQNFLNKNVTYDFLCTKECWGSCCKFDANLSINGKKQNLKDYSLRDYTKLGEDKVAIIFGLDAPSFSNDHNELFIFQSSNAN